MLAIDQTACLACGGCVALCPLDALFLSFDTLECNCQICNLCGICIDFCPTGAIEETNAVKL
ncbi:MAG: 4Fe-4S binding protein [candidate division Zixibacteria bacterium]|nr:4Fe-4S binding protein [candidate division Zixibacteria bacterium]